MTKVLVLKSSILGENSVSNRLIDQFLQQLAEAGTRLDVTSRDVGRAPVAPMDPVRLAALMTHPEQRTAMQQSMVDTADQLIDELREAELVVIGAPMYNFSVPAGLKAWIDQVARAGVTFRYTEAGSLGLLTGKQVVVLATMGGQHLPGETDHLRPYLKTVLNFLGMDRIQFVAAAGLNLGEKSRQQSLRQATERLREVVARVSEALSSTGNSREAA